MPKKPLTIREPCFIYPAGDGDIARAEASIRRILSGSKPQLSHPLEKGQLLDSIATWHNQEERELILKPFAKERYRSGPAVGIKYRGWGYNPDYGPRWLWGLGFADYLYSGQRFDHDRVVRIYINHWNMMGLSKRLVLEHTQATSHYGLKLVTLDEADTIRKYQFYGYEPVKNFLAWDYLSDYPSTILSFAPMELMAAYFEILMEFVRDGRVMRVVTGVSPPGRTDPYRLFTKEGLALATGCLSDPVLEHFVDRMK